VRHPGVPVTYTTILVASLFTPLQRMKLRERYVTSAAAYIGRVGQRAGGVIERWLPGQWRLDDIGGGVEVTL